MKLYIFDGSITAQWAKISFNNNSQTAVFAFFNTVHFLNDSLKINQINTKTNKKSGYHFSYKKIII